jgi:1-deoxy-D-xylulose-5-phosphate reductoisomerase
MSPAVTVSLVGSTGSIGTQAVEVLAEAPADYRVVAIGAHRSADTLVAQAKSLRPEVVAVADPEAATAVRARLPRSIEVHAGAKALADIAGLGEVVLNGVVGFAGLPVTLAALEAGRRLALANKESLIAAGPVVQQARQRGGGEIVPVDSEHSAVFQCLRSAPGPESVRRLLLTASGGPFRQMTTEALAAVGPEQALAHPTWSMGPKITVDSSTLMNKGLEVIEAHELFGVDYDQIEVVIHPQSVVHSMVEFSDGAVLAQLSMPDMRLPISYALGLPRRWPTAHGRIDWATLSQLDFAVPDRSVFRSLDLAYRAGRAGGCAPAWLNAANEVAVEAFLAGQLPWLGIAEVVEEAIDAYDGAAASDVEAVLEADRVARKHAAAAVQARSESR